MATVYNKKRMIKSSLHILLKSNLSGLASPANFSARQPPKGFLKSHTNRLQRRVVKKTHSRSGAL